MEVAAADSQDRDDNQRRPFDTLSGGMECTRSIFAMLAARDKDSRLQAGTSAQTLTIACATILCDAFPVAVCPVQAAGEADARYRHSLQAASEAAAFAAVAAVAAPAVLGSGAMPPAASEPSAPVDLQDSGGGEGHKTWQDSSGTQRLCPPNPELLKAQICACLLDPGFDVECSSTTGKHVAM